MYRHDILNNCGKIQNLLNTQLKYACMSFLQMDADEVAAGNSQNTEEPVVLLESQDGRVLRLSLDTSRKLIGVMKDYEDICGEITQKKNISIKVPWGIYDLNHYVCISILNFEESQSNMSRSHVWEKNDCILNAQTLAFCEEIKTSLLCIIFRIAQYFNNENIMKIISRFLARQFNSCTLKEMIKYIGVPEHSIKIGMLYSKKGFISKWGLWASPTVNRVWGSNVDTDWINYPHNCISNWKSPYCYNTCESCLIVKSLKEHDIDWYILENNPVHPMELTSTTTLENGEVVIVD